MMRTLVTLVVASMTIACSTVRVAQPPPAAELSGLWTGTWRAIDQTNVPREGPVDLDVAQDGARGRGRMVWRDTYITDVPLSVRLAGGMGVPVVFAVSGNTVTMRHELGAKELAMNFTVDGDDIVGTLTTPSTIEVRLTRLTRPGGETTVERVGRLENELSHERGRVGDLVSRVAELQTAVDGTRTAADGAASVARQALAAAGESRQDEAVRARVDELSNGGHADRTVVQSLEVLFAFNKADLDDKSATALLDVVDLLKENPDMTAELEGYADALGSSEYNVRLSQRRVDTVHRYLAKRGVPLERIHLVGLGDLPGKDEQARAKNRRVTVKVLLAED